MKTVQNASGSRRSSATSWIPSAVICATPFGCKSSKTPVACNWHSWGTSSVPVPPELSFNVMAAVAQYQRDNLRTEVLKGMDERVRQGWPTGLAPYGYVNMPDDRDEPPSKPH